MSETADISTPVDPATTLVAEGRTLNLKGEYLASVAKYVEALVIFQERGDFLSSAQTFMQVGNVYMNQSEFSEARNVFTDALGLSIFIDDKTMICKCYNSIGNANGSMGNFDKAIENYGEGLRMATALGDTLTIGTFHNNMAIVCERQGRYAQSLENYLIALRILGSSADKNVLQMIYNNISQIYSHYRNYDEALTYGLKAVELSKETGNKFMQGHAYMGCAHVYNSMGNTDEALDQYRRALDIKLELGDKNGAGIAYNGIGGILQEKGENEAALDHYIKALALNIEVEARSAIGETLSNLGGVYVNLGQYDKAEKNLHESLALALGVGSKKLEAQTLMWLYRLRKKQGDAAAALEYYEQHITVANQVTNADIATQMANLKGTYDLEVKDKEKQAVEKILHNILPVPIANRIRNGEEKIIERFSDVSVLFADIVGFTTWSTNKNVDQVAAMLDRLFGMFDKLAQQNGVEKIKTIGDAYMCVAGLPEPCEDHAERLAHMALDMQQTVRDEFADGEIRVRIGVHRGEVIAGIIGKNKYSFDLWGDTVNIASRMESHGQPDRIQVSADFMSVLKDKYQFEDRGEIDIKGKDKRHTYFLVGELS